MLDTYKIIELKAETYDVKNRFYVLQLCYVNKFGKGKYRLIKQCSSAEKAEQFIKERSETLCLN